MLDIEYTKQTYKYSLRTAVRYEMLNPVDTGGVVCGNEFVNIQDGVLTIAPWYAWDGASGPTIDTKNTMAASLVHDAGYQLMREGHISRKFKAAFDAELERIMLCKGALPIRAAYYRAAVARYGHPATIDHTEVLRA